MLVFVQHNAGTGPAQRPCHPRAERGGQGIQSSAPDSEPEQPRATFGRKIRLTLFFRRIVVLLAARQWWEAFVLYLLLYLLRQGGRRRTPIRFNSIQVRHQTADIKPNAMNRNDRTPRANIESFR